MNFLAHLFLAEDTSGSIVGAMLGDFVPIDYAEMYPHDVIKGIALHKAIDKFTDSHPIFLQSKSRIEDRFRILKGVMVDIFYDHFLAKKWANFNTKTLREFCDHVYLILQNYERPTTENYKYLISRMVEYDWLYSYQNIAGIDRVLKGLSGRISHINILHEGASELKRHYNEFEKDFMKFFPQLMEYCQDFNSGYLIH